MSSELKIFRTEKNFIQFFSGILLVTGFSTLFFVLLFMLIERGESRELFIPIFANFKFIRKELALFNLPLALIIIGIGLRLYSALGWYTTMILTGVLTFGFAYFSYLLSTDAGILLNREIGSVMNPHPISESIAINSLFALIGVFFLIYLSLPSTRKLYF
ncbi:MAG: hypothetical protein MRZ79_18785 [Bacteroidia bacterium]|nr:hypothetical protein [Bacteroidia bacterium]